MEVLKYNLRWWNRTYHTNKDSRMYTMSMDDLRCYSLLPPQHTYIYTSLSLVPGLIVDVGRGRQRLYSGLAPEV